jgi:hypothetical protein
MRLVLANGLAGQQDWFVAGRRRLGSAVATSVWAAVSAPSAISAAFIAGFVTTFVAVFTPEWALMARIVSCFMT